MSTSRLLRIALLDVYRHSLMFQDRPDSSRQVSEAFVRQQMGQSRVSVSPSANLVRFRDAVKEKNSNKLTEVDS